MRVIRRLGLALPGIVALAVAVSANAADAPQRKISYNRDIRPILSNTCYTCHGPDAGTRTTAMRLDTQEGALGKTDSGEIAIVPGKPEESEVYKRIVSHDESLRMPPANAAKQLSEEQIGLIREWIAQGAEWQGHWSFIKPERPVLPQVEDASFPRNPVDYFVLDVMEERGFHPSPEADKESLIRRVTYDMTGLPPTLAEIDSFLLDRSPDAYERLVDRLLDSPQYGEHRARYWLDAARYGDTHGLHLDNERSMWPYREWIIEAFNSNMPFDQFTIEQLAGDRLPQPTMDQMVATGFNRCNVSTGEGGSIDEELRVRYAIDRVEATSTVWMGLTAGCAVCHDHKYDPIKQKEFYQLFAFFNNTADPAMDGNRIDTPPVIKVPTPEQTEMLADLRVQVAALEKNVADEVAKITYKEPEGVAATEALPRADYVWVDDAVPVGAKAQTSGYGPPEWAWVGQPDHPVFSGEKSVRRQTTGLGQSFFEASPKRLTVGPGDVLFAYAYIDPTNPPRELMLQFHDGTNWNHRAIWGEDAISFGELGTPSKVQMGALPETGKWVRLEVEAAKVGLNPGSMISGWACSQFDGAVYWDKLGIVTDTPQDGSQFRSLLAWEETQRKLEKPPIPETILTVVKGDRAARTPEQQKQIENYFVENISADTRGVFAPLQDQLSVVRKQRDDLDAAIPVTFVMGERPEGREARMLNRGEYDKPGDVVQANVPAFLPPMPAQEAAADRLTLARWLVDPSHPLTARVTVNRFWQQYFGTGLVATSEDFGSQGEWPSHPQLLDWLSVEFIESGWDIKHIQRLIVTSAAYRQASVISPAIHKADPDNRLITHGPRYRLDAESIRDTALALSGLLVDNIGGKSVKPYQPPGLWEAVGYTDSNTARFMRDDGAALYRRSVYTFWKRTSPPPSLVTFDAPSREACVVRRPRTNTPLQALALLNDEQFVEAARHLAARIMREGGSTPEDWISYGFRMTTGRHATNEEMSVLIEQYDANIAEFTNNPEAATGLLSVGASKRDESLDPAQHAAVTLIANLLLNLSETVTKG